MEEVQYIVFVELVIQTCMIRETMNIVVNLHSP